MNEGAEAKANNKSPITAGGQLRQISRQQALGGTWEQQKEARRQAAWRQTRRMAAKHSPGSSLNSVPKQWKPQLRIKIPNWFNRLSPKRLALLVAAVIILVLAIVGLHRFLAKPAKAKAKGTATVSTSTAPTLVRGTPKYSTLLPAGKTAAQLGGWTRVSPPDSDPVYAFTDKIGDVQVIISEQPLPSSLQTSDELAKLAEGFAANQTFTAGGATVYIGTSARGPQSLIVAKDKLLILLKSDSVIPDSQWQTYIGSLQ